MSKIVYEALKTPYVGEMDKNIPWNEYPRPSLVRGSFFCLNGLWDFCISREENVSDYTEKILVPFPPESILSGIGRRISRGEFLHYRKKFNIPDGFLKERIIFHFGAVDTVCDVYLNGQHLCHNEGGYIPFSADGTDLLADGENELYVRVKDDLSKIFPYGKQKNKRGGMWYTPVSGIWQTVWAESVPQSYVKKLKITPSVDSVKIEVFGGKEEKVITLAATGERFFFKGNEITISPSEKHLWTPETPYLYNFTLDCGDDRLESYFALREVGITEIGGIKRLTLNGAPYLFNGLLDQGYFPDGIFLPATKRGYEDDILRAKALGFNMLRKHIKVEPEIFYNLCDKLGMVVFQDMVNNSNYSFFFDTALPTVGMKSFPDKLLHRDTRSRKIFEEQMYAEMEHLHNFPSITYYTVFNEGWGQFCADEMYHRAKSFDPTRIIDATSGWFTQRHSDVESLHIYFKPLKLGRNKNRPISISEFGGYSYRVEGHLFGSNNYGYRLFQSGKAYEDAIIKLYSEEVMPLLEKGVCALVYTQLTDVEDETNGFITYDRRVIKVNTDRIHALMTKLYFIYNE